MEDGNDVVYSCVHVYDIAADIGKEFERLIDKFGPDVIRTLMPKVVTTLEHLEALTQRCEDLQVQQESTDALVDELRANIGILEAQRVGIDETRNKYINDVEDIEAVLQEERQQLCDRVSYLLDENRKLSHSVSNHCGLEPFNDNNTETVQRLQTSINSLRQSLTLCQERLSQTEAETAQLQQTADRLVGTNADLRKKHKHSQHTINSLVQERASLQVQLQEVQRDHTELQIKTIQLSQENQDLLAAKQCMTAPMASTPVDPDHRARFSLAELKDILYQRNELKAKVSDLQDQLTSLQKPDEALQDLDQAQHHIICPPEDAYRDRPLVDIDRLTCSSPDEEPGDAPVQGPMPREPYDAPWRKGETGVRKFWENVKRYIQDPPVMGTRYFDYESSIVQDRRRICDTRFTSLDAGNFNSSFLNESPAKIKLNSSINSIETNSLSNYFSDEAQCSPILDIVKVDRNKNSAKKKFSNIRSFFRKSATLLSNTVASLSRDNSFEDVSIITDCVPTNNTDLSCTDEHVASFVSENE